MSNALAAYAAVSSARRDLEAAGKRVSRFVVTRTGTETQIGTAEYRHGGAGFSCGIKDAEVWDAVDEAVSYLIGERGAVSVNMRCGITVAVVE